MTAARPAPRFPVVKGRLPQRLVPCPGCYTHIYPQAKVCPHCKGRISALRKKQLARLEKAAEAVETLKRLFKVD